MPTLIQSIVILKLIALDKNLIIMIFIVCYILTGTSLFDLRSILILNNEHNANEDVSIHKYKLYNKC